jgi:hypothetical protein
MYIDAKFGAALGSERLLEAVRLCDKLGIKAIVQGGGVNNGGLAFDADSNDYSVFPNFDGVMSDEPLTVGELEALHGSLLRFKEKYPDRNFYVNAVGMPGEAWDIYIAKYKELLLDHMPRKHLSGDMYPLLRGGMGVEAGYLQYLQRVSDTARGNGAEFSFFLQTMSITGIAHRPRRPSKEDIRFCSYVIMAYGARGLQHFCYAAPGGPPYTGEFGKEDYACLTDGADGYRKTEIYGYARDVMSELKKFEHIFLDFRAAPEGVMTVSGANAEGSNPNFTESSRAVTHGRIKSVTTGEDAIIGCFRNEKGLDAFMAVNFCDPARKRACKTAIRFNAAAEAIEVKDGVPKAIALKNGEYTADLQPGEGRFIILPAAPAPRSAAAAPAKPAAPPLKAAEERIAADSPNVELYEDFSDFSDPLKRYPETYNIWGTGRAGAELTASGYPDGLSGRVLRLFTDIAAGHDWSAYQILAKPVQYADTKSVVINIYCTSAAFSLSFSCDPLNRNYPQKSFAALPLTNRLAQIRVPFKEIRYEGMTLLDRLYVATGAGVPFGTVAYIDSYCIVDEKPL